MSEVRDEAPCCMNCKHSELRGRHNNEPGECRRFPPQFSGSRPQEAHYSEAQWHFPIVRPMDVCGEWEPLESGIPCVGEAVG